MPEVREVSSSQFPTPSQQPLAVDFLENRSSDFRRMSEDITYKFDATRAKFIATPQLVDLAEEVNAVTDADLDESKKHLMRTTANFDNALKTLREAKDRNGKPLSLRLGQSQNWEEVTTVIQNAITKYESGSKGWRSIRKAFRRVSNNAASIQKFVNLLPDGTYKTLCGGLTLILTAMMEHSKMRVKLEALLEELPETVNKCEQYAKLYAGKNSLTRCVHEIYVSVFMALEELIHWYEQSVKKHIWQSGLKNDAYGESIDRYIMRIRESKDRFSEETKLYAAWVAKATLMTTQKTGADVLTLSKDMEMTFITTKKTGADVSAMSEEMGTMRSQMQAMNSTLELLQEQTKNAKWNDEKEAEQFRLREAYEQGKLEGKEKDRRIEELMMRVNQTKITSIWLSEFLEITSARRDCAKDLQAVLSFGLTEPARFQSSSRSVSVSKEFRKWMQSKESRVLFLQCHSDFERITAGSFLIKLVQENLRGAPGTLVLTFFCGLHNPNDMDAQQSGPTLIAKSLLGQLLALEGLDVDSEMEGNAPLAFLNLEKVKRMQHGSYDTYMDVIADLVRVVGKRFKATFIMVDSIDFYDSLWEDEIDQFLEMLREVTKTLNKRRESDENIGVLKVLVAASCQAKYFHHRGKYANVVEIQEDNDEDEQDSFEELE